MSPASAPISPERAEAGGAATTMPREATPWRGPHSNALLSADSACTENGGKAANLPALIAGTVSLGVCGEGKMYIKAHPFISGEQVRGNTRAL